MYFVIATILFFCASNSKVSSNSIEKCNELQCVQNKTDLVNKKRTSILWNDSSAENGTDGSRGDGTTTSLERFSRFLSDPEVKIRAPNNANVKSAFSLISNRSDLVRRRCGLPLKLESRSRKLLRKYLLPLLILLKFKAVSVIGTILSIAVASFTGLGVSVMALVLAGVAGLNSLVEDRPSGITYEVVPQLVVSPWNRVGLESVPHVYHYHTIP